MTTFNKKYLDYIDIMFYVNDVARAYGKYEELKPYLYQHIIRTNQYMLSRLGIRTKWAYYEKMKKDYILHKKEIEDVMMNYTINIKQYMMLPSNQIILLHNKYG